jgi:predicted nucleotidyltransferase component of viral defense system
MPEDKKDPIASIRGRLQGRARAQKINPARFLTAYLLEGLIARIGKSAYSNQLILKGGLSLYGRYGMTSRPTEDIDLSVRAIPNELEAIKTVFQDILAIELEDYIEFDQNFQMNVISEDAISPGVRLDVPWRLGAAHDTLQVDLSFGAKITPNASLIEFPTVLNTSSLPILGYPLETLIAEKFAAACEKGDTNTRSKDFFDLYTVASLEQFSAEVLREAIERTFEARGTALETSRLVFLAEFAEHRDLQSLWTKFLQRQRLSAPPEFRDVMKRIQDFLEPIMTNNTKGTWQPNEARWQE